MSFILIGENFAHYHLSASSQRAFKLNANYLLIDYVADYMISNHPELSVFHLGGGRTNLANDSLLAFKAKFSPTKNNFFIAGNVYNQDVYREYVDKAILINPLLKQESYFLKYRLEYHE
jgi:lipid II:glycine glycyltransferase (peptidoglycan interpeptide bridge formation enzyme)